ncbi:MAG: TrmH family RNA methyltransferase [Myxococcota bacterium]
MSRPTEPLRVSGLPEGPPLHLERPGRAAELLAPFLRPERLARLREVLGRRTRHLTALVEHVHDPHNLAACVRSSDAFGIQDLHVVPKPGSSTRLARDITRGTQRWLTIHRHADTGAAVRRLREAGYRIAATDLGGEEPPIPLPDLPVDTPVCIAFGNEHEGISPALRRLADVRVHIPMHGFVESLNVSVAFALAVSRLRDAVDATVGGEARLTPEEQRRVLDRWVVEDVPRARAVLGEIARRSTSRIG